MDPIVYDGNSLTTSEDQQHQLPDEPEQHREELKRLLDAEAERGAEAEL